MKVGWYKKKSTERNSKWNLILQHEFWIFLIKLDSTAPKLIRQYNIRLIVTKTRFLASIPLHNFHRRKTEISEAYLGHSKISLMEGFY